MDPAAVFVAGHMSQAAHERKGIILAGGSGTRLYPVTQPVSKQLLPIYDKPMIYYPMSVLMLAGIRDILIISTPQDTPRFEQLFGDGRQWGINLHYAVQSAPNGIAEALIIGKHFIGTSSSALILGDNLFYGHELPIRMKRVAQQQTGATIFAYPVQDPQRYGVVDFDPEWRIVGITEKPEAPRSRFAVTGLYFYDADAPRIASTLQPSARGELEITDVNNAYLQAGKLKAEVLSRGFAWLDTGTHESLLEASMFIQTIEKRQGLKIACLEEIAYRQGYIDAAGLEALTVPLRHSSYGQYLVRVLRDPLV